MARRKTKSYPESFRKEAVRLADQSDRTAADVARELGIQVKYALIESCRSEFTVTMMCRVLAVSRSGFYAWLKRPVCQRDQRRALVGTAVEAAYTQFKLKVELIYAENYKTVEAAHSGIFEYIEGFYNRSRRHSAIGYVSPHVYEQQFEQLIVSTFRG